MEHLELIHYSARNIIFAVELTKSIFVRNDVLFGLQYLYMVMLDTLSNAAVVSFAARTFVLE
jgi:hypothetical protein